MISNPNIGRAAASFVRLFEMLLFPGKCLKCGVYMEKSGVVPHTLEACFCGHCLKQGVYPVVPPFCTACGIRFHKSSGDNHMCGTCLKTPLMLGRVRAVAEYKGIIKDGIQLLKYHSKTSLAKTFEHLMFKSFQEFYGDLAIDLVIPMPLHKSRMRKRGFNQAYFLFRNFKKLYHRAYRCRPTWDLDLTSLIRVKKTMPQTGFDIEERKENLKNAFRVVREDHIQGKHILIIDDVFTTGATCNEAAKELLKHGAAGVDALVLARA